VRLWRTPVGPGAAPPLDTRRALRQAYVATALNPKGIAFFVAFVPQFLDQSSPFLPQAALLVATVVLLAAPNAAC
jgi:threonine/homoserine/homoserine lactone efflux protein